MILPLRTCAGVVLGLSLPCIQAAAQTVGTRDSLPAAQVASGRRGLGLGVHFGAGLHSAYHLWRADTAASGAMWEVGLVAVSGDAPWSLMIGVVNAPARDSSFGTYWFFIEPRVRLWQASALSLEALLRFGPGAITQGSSSPFFDPGAQPFLNAIGVDAGLALHRSPTQDNLVAHATLQYAVLGRLRVQDSRQTSVGIGLTWLW